MTKYILRAPFSQLLLILIGFIAIISILWCPITYSRVYNYFLFSLFLISLFTYVYKKKITNFLDFEPIFICIFLLMTYVYPLWIFDDETAFLFSFGRYYDVNAINKGVALSTIAIIFFFVGNLAKITIRCSSEGMKNLYVDNRLLGIFALFLYVVYYLLGGFDFFTRVYKGEGNSSPIANYILVFIQVVFPTLLFNEFWNKKNNSQYSYNTWVFLLAMTVSIHFALVGSRTNTSIILLSGLVAYSIFIKKQTFLRLLVFLLIGIFVMWILQSFRAGYDVEKDIPWFYILSDLFIPNTNTYVAVEIVEEKGVTWGLSSSASVLSIIPFLQGFVENFLGLSDEDINSAYLLTEYLGSSAGMGTNFIADLYLSFGIFGVIVFSYVFGWILSYLKSSIYNSYYKALIYIIISGFSMYIVRSSLFFLLKFVVFSFVIAKIFSRSTVSSKKLC